MGWPAEGEEDREKRWCEEDSPERDENAEQNGTEQCSPPGDSCGAMKDVWTDDEAFEDDDEAVESEYQTEAPLVVSAEGNGQNWTDEGDHSSICGDELQEATQ